MVCFGFLHDLYEVISKSELLLVLTIKIIIQIYSSSIMDLSSAPVIASMIAFTGTITVAFISIFNNRKTTNENRRLIVRTDLIEKRKFIELKLNEFYIPLRHNLEQSKTLFKIFMKDKPDNFRTLTYLLNPEQEYGVEKTKVLLNQNDKALLEMIIEIGNRIETLIHEKSYLIGDDTEFVNNYKPSEGYRHVKYDEGLTLISLLISHLVTIRLAFNGKISGQVTKFESYVFPNEINSKVNIKINELEGRVISYESQILQLIK